MIPTEYAFQLALGFFFASAGYHKLFVPAVNDRMTGLFQKIKVPQWQQMLVMWGEFLGGLGLLFGVLPQLAAAGLLVIIAGAIYLVCYESDVKSRNPNDPADWLQKCLYMPEGLMLLMLTHLVVSADNYGERILLWIWEHPVIIPVMW